MKIIKKIMMITSLMLSLTAMAPISSCSNITNSAKSTNILDSSVASSETHIEDIKVKNKDQLTSLQVGKQAQIQTEILPENALVKNITYESLNEDIATVTPNGIINAHKQGRVKIYAKAKICVKAKCKWWPYDVVSVYDEFYVNVFTEGVNIKFIDGENGTVSSSALVAQKGSTLNEIISNYNISCTPNEGYIFDCWVDGNNNPINIDSEITNDITIKAMFKEPPFEKPTFENDSWENIIRIANYINQGFDIDIHKIYGVDTLIGLEKEIVINNHVHKAKVIDEWHDTCAETGKKAMLTFQLTTLLSDENGNAIKTMWDTIDNYDYTNSILRANLNGTGSGTKTFSSTVLSMLPQELQDGIKTVTKKVAITSGYTVNEYNDKLFPLTYTEMAQSGSTYTKVEGTAYSYWIDHNTNNERIKKDANNNAYYYWLCSPFANHCNYAWYVSGDGGSIDLEYVDYTYGVSFGFCI